MDNLVTLIPSLVKHMPVGIQALTFIDRFISWDHYHCMMNKDLSMEGHLSENSFLKLALLKYVFGFSAKETLETASDRDSFRSYVGHKLSPEFLMEEVLQPLEQFVSPFGKLAELIEGIEQDIGRHDIYLERKMGGWGSRLVPYLVHKDHLKTNDFLSQRLATWL